MSKKKKKKNSKQNQELNIKKIENTEHITKDKKSDIDDFYDTKKKKDDINIQPKKKKHFFVNLFLILLLISSLGYFIVCLFLGQDNNSLQVLVESLLLVLFSLLFVSVAITSNKKKKGTIFLSSLLLLSYFLLKIGCTTGYIEFPSVGHVENFSGRSLTDVIEWAEANNIDIEQEYEYSDMISEYFVISQDIEAGTKIKDVKKITIAVSEGPNPSKEIIVPNMVSWDSERVLNFVKENYLSNVDVEFVESDKAKDTVIEQNKSGNLKRNEEIKLTFSAGEEFETGEVKLIDFTGKSKFEVTFYLKQNRIKYEFKDKFSKKIKRGYAVSQSIEAGTMVKVDDETVIVDISKGPKIKVPDLTSMTMTEITDWVIKNKLKLEFTDRYDDSALENDVLEANYSKGDVIEQNTTIKIVISKGKLKMPKFDSLDEFREWADKYEIKYEEKHEFSDSVEAGKVISYSYEAGDVIKNNDVIIITISDGEKLEVPNLKGLTKSEVTSKLKKLGLNYNFVYKASNSVKKDKVIGQSISAGSEVSKGTTVTVTLSNGKKESTSKREESSSSNSNNNSSSSSNNSNSSNSSNNNSSDSSSNTSTPSTPSCVEKTYTVGGGLRNIFNNNSGYSSVESALYAYFRENYPNVKISVVGEGDTGMSPGSYVGGIGPGTQVTSCNSQAYVIRIAK